MQLALCLVMTLALPAFSQTPMQGSISGWIKGDRADGFKSAQVVAVSIDPGSGFKIGADVDPNGAYTLKGIPDGLYQVLAMAEGYTPTYYENSTTPEKAVPVKVSGGASVQNINIALVSTPVGKGSISGRVGSPSSSTPVVNATVYAFSKDNPFLSGVGQTSGDGTYRIESLVGGDYYVQVYAEGYLSEFYNDALTPETATLVKVVEPNATARIDFRLSRGGTINGWVRNSDGKPVAGVSVDAVSAAPIPPPGDPTDPGNPTDPGDPKGRPGGYGWATTDDNGFYSITGLTAGDYLVHASVWSAWTSAEAWYPNAATPDDARPVAVAIDQTSSNISFKLDIPSADGVISGAVFDTAGKPIGGAFIYVESPFDPSGRMKVGAYAQTEADGTYRVEGLPDGTYHVSASASSGWSSVQRWWPGAESPDQASDVVIKDATTTPGSVNFRLPLKIGTGKISGTVLLADGSPAMGAMIDFAMSNAADRTVQYSMYAYTDDKGYYELGMLPEGSYIAHASFWQADSLGDQWYKAASKLEEATPIVIGEDETRKGIDFTLAMRPYYGTLAGTVTDDLTGAAHPRAYVNIYPIDYGNGKGYPYGKGYGDVYMPLNTSAVTDASGHFQLEKLPEGKYMLQVIATGAHEFYQDAPTADRASMIEVRGGSVTTANVSLTQKIAGNGAISGRVAGDGTTQIDLAVVMAWPAKGERDDFFTAVTEPDGRYSIPGLAEGDYLVFASASDAIGEYFDDAYDPSMATLVHVGATGVTGSIDFGLSGAMDYPAKGPGVGAPSTNAGVYGKVTDESGKPLHDAMIYLVGNSEKPISSARSGADGTYQLDGVPAGGAYRLRATKAGYESRYNSGAKDLADAAPIAPGAGKQQVDFQLSAISSGIGGGSTAVVSGSIALRGTTPNPFSDRTRIGFELARTTQVRVTIVDLLGNQVARLVDGTLSAGVHDVIWDGRDGFGKPLGNGVYVYRVENGTESKSGTVVLTR